MDETLGVKQMSLADKQIIKSCLFCKHILHEAGGALSDVTWESGQIKCEIDSSRLWVIGDEIDLIELGDKVMQAETCIDFELHPDVIDELNK